MAHGTVTRKDFRSLSGPNLIRLRSKLPAALRVTDGMDRNNEAYKIVDEED